VTLAVSGVFAQQPAERPAFEVASIKMYAPGSPVPPDAANAFKSFPDGVTAKYTKLWACLEWAYDLPGRVFGPDWIRSERYDIVAKTAGPVPEAQLKRMVQTLLEDRFNLKVHRETRVLEVAVLVVGKSGPKNLHATDAEVPPSYQPADDKFVVKNSPMSRFVAFLGNRPPYGVNEQVIDQTGLKGVFDITLNVSGFDFDDPAFRGEYEEMRSSFFVFFSEALEKQYGVKLEHRSLPLESLIVDGGNKVPSEN
jgi:uncharacterized protein (TIGR03435 family)